MKRKRRRRQLELPRDRPRRKAFRPRGNQQAVDVEARLLRQRPEGLYHAIYFHISNNMEITKRRQEN
ncbi:hypothetical protein D3C83_56440 [compost metagenome]